MLFPATKHEIASGISALPFCVHVCQSLPPSAVVQVRHAPGPAKGGSACSSSSDSNSSSPRSSSSAARRRRPPLPPLPFLLSFSTGGAYRRLLSSPTTLPLLVRRLEPF